jgi:hypothetical protein
MSVCWLASSGTRDGFAFVDQIGREWWNVAEALEGRIHKTGIAKIAET